MPTNAETRAAALYQVRLAWENRASTLGLKKGTKGRGVQLEAYLQGALAALTCLRVMSHDEAARVAFLVMVGRAEEWIAAHQAPAEVTA